MKTSSTRSPAIHGREVHVDGYPEDETPKTRAIEARCNDALRDFCAAWEGVTPWDR